jgi:hypothetical protein
LSRNGRSGCCQQRERGNQAKNGPSHGNGTPVLFLMRTGYASNSQK